jgi:hypothetical protein
LGRGAAGRVAGQAIDIWSRGHSAAAGALSRFRERARDRELAREYAREARIASAKAQASIARQHASAAMHDDRRGPGA